MSQLLKIKSYLGIFIALCISVYCIFEIFDYRAQPEEYERVYRIGNEDGSWQYRSGQNLIQWNLALTTISLFYIVTALVYIFKYTKNKIFSYCLLMFELIFVVWFIWQLYSWYSIGFDH